MKKSELKQLIKEVIQEETTPDVPNIIRDLGFHVNDTEDQAYLDRYPKHTRYIGYDDESEYDNPNYKFPEIGIFNKFSNTLSDISLTWNDLTLNEIKIVLQKSNYFAGAVWKTYFKGGEKEVIELANSVFSFNNPRVGFHSMWDAEKDTNKQFENMKKSELKQLIREILQEGINVKNVGEAKILLKKNGIQVTSHKYANGNEGYIETNNNSKAVSLLRSMGLWKP